MITNARSRVLHEPPLYLPDPGKIMVFDSGTKIFVPTTPISSTADFNATDFDLQNQINLGMTLKPSQIASSNLDLADSIDNAAAILTRSEFEKMQEVASSNETYIEPENTTENG